MSRTIFSEYRRLRQLDWPAAKAWDAAKVNDAFEELDGDLVMWAIVPEHDVYDDSYIDAWDISPKRKEALKRELAERISREGCWIVVSYFRPSADDEWIAVDSVGGFIGDDMKDSGYDVDLKRAALDALAAEPTLKAKYT